MCSCPLFLQVLLALCLSWLLCFILTVTHTLPSDPSAYGFQARTDTKGDVLNQAPWFRFPYPGKGSAIGLGYLSRIQDPLCADQSPHSPSPLEPLNLGGAP